MTRETLPRFDLYGELEVSPFASVGTIEAAFRALVKQHHPDVASGDESRMTRLNLAREWLTDPELRRRYDRETDRGRQIPSARRPLETHSVVTRSYAERTGSGARPSRRSSAGPPQDAERTFGIHADEVRAFLAELRSLDRPRAQRVWNGRAVAHTKGYTQALRAAASAARGPRLAEWQFAREAASVIARGKLGDSTLSDQVADVLSDIAGAIAIRDLLSAAEFSLVHLPWTWRGTVKLPEMPGAAVEERVSLDSRRPSEVGPSVAPVAPVQPVAPVGPVGPIAAPAVPPVVAAPTPAVPPKPLVEPQPILAKPDLATPPPWPLERPPVTPDPPAPTQPVVSPVVSLVIASAAAPPPAVSPGTPPAPAPMPLPTPPPSLAPKPATPFVAASAPPRQPPSWPSRAQEPRAQPPHDARISDRLAAALAATPVRPGDVTPNVRARPAGLRAAVFAPPSRRSIGPLPIVLTTASLVIFLGAALLAFPATKPSQAVAADTDAPGSVPGVALGSAAPRTPQPSMGPGATDQGPVPTEPLTPGGGGATPPPGPGTTPRPTRPASTPKPTPPGQTQPPAPTPTAPGPTPTLPPPTPSPDALCTVPDLVGMNSSNILPIWTGAGFGATAITYNPTIPPQYKVAWQSLAAGTHVVCSSAIEVRKTAP